jgi:hypothetical protein
MTNKKLVEAVKELAGTEYVARASDRFAQILDYLSDDDDQLEMEITLIVAVVLVVHLEMENTWHQRRKPH